MDKLFHYYKDIAGQMVSKGKLITLEGIDGIGKCRIEEIKRKVSIIVELLKLN